MGVITRLLAPEPKAYGPIDDYWYTSLGTTTLTGVRIDADSAMKVSAVWACVRLISETMASLPLTVYRRLPDDERERATDYYLYRVLRQRPNDYQIPFEFKQMLTAHALLRGDGYGRIVPGRQGFASQVLPLHPGRMTPEWQDASGRWRGDSDPNYASVEVGAPVRYKYLQASGKEQIFPEEEIFHLRGPWTHGLKGLSVIEHARETIGLARATEEYGARFFGQNARPGGLLKMAGKLSEEGAKKLKKRWEEAYGGLTGSHRVAVLEEGLEWQQLGMTNEDAQFLLTRSFQVEDIARWFNVPLHMIQHSEKSTTWGTGIEQITLGFIKFTLRSWAARWEQCVARDLIAQPDIYYAEFDFNDLERGDLKTRYEAYQIGRNGGWLSANDVRRKENMNPVEGPAGDAYWRPANMVNANEPNPEPAPAPRGNNGRDLSGAAAITEGLMGLVKPNGHYLTLLHGCAERVVRKETSALPKLAKRHCDDNDAWCQAVSEFYAEHSDFVAQTMGISRCKAEAYTSDQRAIVLQGGAGALEDWGHERIPALIELAIGGNDGD